MLKEKRSWVVRYSVATLAVGVALLVKLLLDPAIEEEAPFLLFFAAIIISAYFGGLKPGLLATALAALAAWYFFLSPFYSFQIDSFGQGLRLFLFVMEGMVVTSLVAAMRSARWRADLSVRQAQEDRRRLRQSEERFRLLVEGAKDYAIFMLDPRGRIATWNIGAEHLLGYREAEVTGQHVSLLFTPEDVRQEVPEQELRRAANEGRAEAEHWYVRKDGTRLWAGGVVTPLLGEGRSLRGFAKVMRDFTERKRAEEEKVRQVRYAALRADVNAAFVAGDSLRGVLQRCTEAMVRHLDSTFSRVWTLYEVEVMLELRARVGLYKY